MKKPSTKHLMFETRVSLPIDERRQMVDQLNQVLATTSDLYAALKQAHWSVKGPDFFSLHLLFDQIAEEVEVVVDDVAERITALGGTAFGTIQSANENTVLKPYPTDIFNAEHHLIAIAERIAATSHLTRNNIKIAEELGDMGTSDLYIEITRQLDKRLWFIEAHMQTTEKL